MAKEIHLQYECCCVDCGGQERWNELMKHKRKCSYRLLVKKVQRDYPELYEELALEFYNPYMDLTYSTPTHYVLTSSAIEYFFRKV